MELNHRKICYIIQENLKMGSVARVTLMPLSKALISVEVRPVAFLTNLSSHKAVSRQINCDRIRVTIRLIQFIDTSK